MKISQPSNEYNKEAIWIRKKERKSRVIVGSRDVEMFHKVSGHEVKMQCKSLTSTVDEARESGGVELSNTSSRVNAL